MKRLWNHRAWGSNRNQLHMQAKVVIFLAVFLCMMYYICWADIVCFGLTLFVCMFGIRILNMAIMLTLWNFHNRFKKNNVTDKELLIFFLEIFEKFKMLTSHFTSLTWHLISHVYWTIYLPSVEHLCVSVYNELEKGNNCANLWGEIFFCKLAWYAGKSAILSCCHSNVVERTMTSCSAVYFTWVTSTLWD